MNYMQLALVHSSSNPVDNNERLEFLGDAVLEIVVTEWLFKQYPKAKPGKLTALRTESVCTANLARVGNRLGIGHRLQVGGSIRGEGGLNNPKLLADAVEAYIGALYLTCGMDKARDWIRANIILTFHAA